jgi:hypothetical protein
MGQKPRIADSNRLKRAGGRFVFMVEDGGRSVLEAGRGRRLGLEAKEME